MSTHAVFIHPACEATNFHIHLQFIFAAMKVPFFVFASVLLFSACSGGEKKIVKIEKKVVWKAPVAVAPNREMMVEIAGMSCVHACGGSIRTALRETNAVDRVSFDFVTDRKVNTAFITFDKEKITADRILNIINTLNDKQFTTGKVSTKSLEAPPAAETTPVKVEIEKKQELSHTTTNVDATGIQFPNLFDLFVTVIS